MICTLIPALRWLASGALNTRASRSRLMQRSICTLVGMGHCRGGMPPKFALQNSDSTQAFAGLTIAIAIQVAVPLLQQRLGQGVGADLAAPVPAAPRGAGRSVGSRS